MDAGEKVSVSANIGIDASLQYADTITVTPPMYTSANSVEVASKADLWTQYAENLGGSMEDYSGFLQVVKLVTAFIIA
jgi:hypothetical protein